MWLQNEALSLVLKGAYFKCSSIRSLLFYYTEQKETNRKNRNYHFIKIYDKYFIQKVKNLRK